MSADSIPTNIVLQRAMQLGRLGYRVLRVHPNDKRPVGLDWPREATENRWTIHEWFSGQDLNVGVACGPQPNGINLVVVDVDVNHDGLLRWAELTDINGIPDTALHGTPSGGMHLFFDSPIPLGNSGRLGRGIDVRGAGGQVVVPPSSRIIGGEREYYSTEERRGLHQYAVAPLPEWLLNLLHEPVERSIERHPSQPRPRTPGEPLSNPDWLRDHWDWVAELVDVDGYTVVKQVGDVVYLAHPTATSEWSCTVDPTEGRMNAYSTNMPQPWREAQWNRDGSSTSWSPYDWFVVARCGGDASEATREINRRRGYVGGSGGRPERAADEAPPSDDPPSINLPTGFWDERPILAQIRKAAWSALVSPDALLVHVLARCATLIPPSWKLPGVEQGMFGTPGTLDMIGCVVAETSGGKTSAAGVAQSLVPGFDDDDDHSVMPPAYAQYGFDLPIGSGEGIPQWFMVPKWYLDSEGEWKKGTGQVQGRTGLFLSVDEGTGFTNTADRKGTTIVSTVASAFSGATLGQLNAAEQTNRLLRAGKARICVVINMQDSNAYLLYTPALEGIGFTGRLLFASAHDPSAPPPEDAPDWPGRLVWTPPPASTLVDQYFTYDRSIIDESKRLRWGVLNGTVTISKRQSQHLILRCKIAAVLACWEGRTHVTTDDWDVAQQILTGSNAVLAHLEAHHSTQIEEGAVQAATFKLTVATKATTKHVSMMKVTWKGRLIERLKKGPKPWKGLKDIVEGGENRKHLKAALDELVSEGVVRQDGARYEIVP